MNQLEMATVQAIASLWARGWSIRRIARELSVDRGTVARHVRQAQAAGIHSKPANAPTGSEEEFRERTRYSEVPPGAGDQHGPADQKDRRRSDGEDLGGCPSGTGSMDASSDGSRVEDNAMGGRPEEAGFTRGRATQAEVIRGCASACEPFRTVIVAMLGAGLSAQRIFQDLTSDHGYAGSYYSVRRFVRRLGASRPLPFRRIEQEPGVEAQVDFGSGAPIVDPSRKSQRRRPHVFRIVLSYSRKAYSEVVYRQRTEDFVRCVENAFWHFGGAPRVLVIDNLRAAVKNPDWFDPELSPKVQSFCEHYGVTILPTKPYTPRHKGKVERGIDYVKENGLKGKTFANLEDENRHLADWETNVADKRIHGTTRKQVAKVFIDIEKPALQPLPADRFPFFHKAQRQVSRDGHIEVDKAYYSVPPEYLGRPVWVRWDARTIRVFNSRMEQIALHLHVEPGQFRTDRVHLADEKISAVERGAASMLTKARQIGDETARWAEAMIQARGIEGLRVLLGLLSLTKKHRADDIEHACATALSYGAFRLRTVRQLIGRQSPKQSALEFLDEHPIIRSMSDYGELVRSAIHKETFS